MTTFEFDVDGASGLGCEIPADGANALRLIGIDGDVPVVLRDPIDDERHFRAFHYDVRKASPATPDRVEPDIAFTLGVHNGGRVRMPDGRDVRFMSFHHWDDSVEDDDDQKDFPGPLLRVREGQIVHTTLIPSRNTHTIHHHGIEPTPHNDGVGHTSFEVDDRYTYQWLAHAAGTYFYHCHKNTVLHFEQGMYGPLIVDPPQGPGFARRGEDVVPYDQEVMWVPDDVDPAWHDIDHMTGLRLYPFDPTPHLLHFDPQYWMISGVPHPRSRTDRDVAVRCDVGERLMVRLLNAAYGPVSITLPFPAEVIGVDGHSPGGGKDARYSRVWTHPAGVPIELSTAQRYDLLVTPEHVGEFTVAMDFRHWITGAVYGRAETTITVR